MDSYQHSEEAKCYTNTFARHCCPFTGDSSIVIQIRWKIDFSVTPLYGFISLRNFAHAVVPWATFHSDHLIKYSGIKCPSNLNYGGKIARELGPLAEIHLFARWASIWIPDTKAWQQGDKIGANLQPIWLMYVEITACKTSWNMQYIPCKTKM